MTRDGRKIVVITGVSSGFGAGAATAFAEMQLDGVLGGVSA
jgi:NADP-dependent 3-hydroxy acid dehydrogenase YdfG